MFESPKIVGFPTYMSWNVAATEWLRFSSTTLGMSDTFACWSICGGGRHKNSRRRFASVVSWVWVTVYTNCHPFPHSVHSGYEVTIRIGLPCCARYFPQPCYFSFGVLFPCRMTCHVSWGLGCDLPCWLLYDWCTPCHSLVLGYSGTLRVLHL